MNVLTLSFHLRPLTMLHILNNPDGMFWGLVISIGLFGFSVLQGWIYFHENTDKRPLKLFVAIILALNIATTGLDAQIMHSLLVSPPTTDFIAAVGATIPSLVAEGVMTVITVFLVQIFYAMQAYKLAKSSGIIPGFIIFCASSSFVAGIVCVSDLGHNWMNDLGGTRVKFEIAFSIGLAAISDITTMLFLSTVLWIEQMRTDGAKLKSTIKRLIIYTIIRGLLLTIAQILCLLMFLAMPRTPDWISIYLCLSKLYPITLVAVLNSRTHLSTAGYPIDITTPVRMCDSSPPTAVAEARAHWKLRIVCMLQKALCIEHSAISTDTAIGSEPSLCLGLETTKSKACTTV